MRKQHYSHYGPKEPMIHSNKKGGVMTGRTKDEADKE